MKVAAMAFAEVKKAIKLDRSQLFIFDWAVSPSRRRKLAGIRWRSEFALSVACRAAPPEGRAWRGIVISRWSSGDGAAVDGSRPPLQRSGGAPDMEAWHESGWAAAAGATLTAAGRSAELMVAIKAFFSGRLRLEAAPLLWTGVLPGSLVSVSRYDYARSLLSFVLCLCTVNVIIVVSIKQLINISFTVENIKLDQTRRQLVKVKSRKSENLRKNRNLKHHDEFRSRHLPRDQFITEMRESPLSRKNYTAVSGEG